MKKLMIAFSLTGSIALAQEPPTCSSHGQHSKAREASIEMQHGQSPYAGMEKRAVKSLSEQQIADYRSGAGMGYGMTGELNGYPGPKHVLEMAEALGITADQKRRLEASKLSMHKDASLLGEEIITRETQLDNLFSSGVIDAAALSSITADIGRLQGRLRAVHLAAHLMTRQILTKDQIHQYARARGYGHALHR